MRSNFEFLNSRFPVLANFGELAENIYTAIPTPA